MGDTRRRILDTARALFNEHGSSRVGVRDVARATGMSPGNLAYHFPTKDALVTALLMDLYELNQRSVFTEPMQTFSLASLYAAATGAMRNTLDYRFVLLNYADAVRASPELAGLEADLAKKRRGRHDAMLAALVENGSVERVALARSDVLYEQSSMISSGWLTAAAIRGWDDERAVLHFAKVGCALLAPHCTERGTREMRRIMRGELDGPAPKAKSGRKGK